MPQELMSIFMDTFPIRIRNIYVIRQPWYFTMFWAIMRPFFKKKITSRVHLLGGDLASLHRAVPPSILPPAFGGTMTDPPMRFVDDLARVEKSAGCLGGFRLPFSVDSPYAAAGSALSAAAASTGGCSSDSALTPAVSATGARSAGVGVDKADALSPAVAATSSHEDPVAVADPGTIYL